LQPLPPNALETLHQAIAAHQAGKFAEAEELYRRVLEVDAKQFPVLVMLGVLKGQVGRYVEAERLLGDALLINPNDAGAQFSYGNALLALHRFDEAFAAFGKALAINPEIAEAHLNRGGIQMSRKQFEEAIGSFEAAIRINLNYAEAYCNLGQALEETRRFAEALANCDTALKINPQNAEFHAARANILHRLKRDDEALEALSAALSMRPDHAGLHYNRGNILFQLKRFDEAFQCYDQAFRLDPQLDYVEGDRFFAKLMVCDWAGLADESERLRSGVAAGRPVARPFAFLPVKSSQALQIQCANMFADREFPAFAPFSTGQRYGHDRIRIAYLSADFRDHPVSHLLVGMFEHHDRTRFKTMGISVGDSEPTPMRQRLEGAFEHFIDARESSDAIIARMLREHEIDIAIDLMGPTQAARPGIFSHRPAPIQVIYLGFAGSSGTSYMDYIIADRIVIPETEQHLFREKVVYLPDTFMGTDSERTVAVDTPSRADEGLPESGFVFCCFSNTYKISPEIFDVWMDVLRTADNSLLWLSNTNDAAKDNLRREAKQRAINPERIVFARRVALNRDHLARHRLADLFLDTMPLGAHSTICDALWAGTPVLTCAGTTFGGRVAASVLSSLGLPELITHDASSYKNRALQLASDPNTLEALRARLAAHRTVFSLFDTRRFTRHIEAAYISMWERYQKGEAPAALSVQPLP
jgi:protein O-GlcNAc transferase